MGFATLAETVASSDDLRDSPPDLKSQYAHLDVTQIGGALGARIDGIDLCEDLDDAAVSGIKAALADHSVLLFPEQTLEPKNLVKLAEYFGELEEERFIPKLEGYPGVHVLKGASKSKLTTQNLIWHVDHSYKEQPLMLAALYAIDVPAAGGDTLFSNMSAAYDALSDRMKAYLEGLTAIHDVVAYGLRSGLFENSDARAAIARMPPAVEHPLVCIHPLSGRKMLFVNESWTTKICGLEPHESETILKLLYEHAARPEFQLRLNWQNKALCIWDNLAVQHRGIPDYNGPRLMHRVSVTGTWRPH